MEKQRRQLTPEQDALEHIVNYKDKPFLEERFIDSFKGRGVFTNKAIEPSTFVVEYRGIIICRKKPKSKSKRKIDTLNNFLYEFTWKGAQWCTDAATEDGTLGRLVNDDNISPNCEMKKIEWEGKPHLCLFAVKNISPGEEITYNYGCSSYLWRSLESCDGPSTSNTDLYDTSTPRGEKREDVSHSEESCSNGDKIPESEQGHDSDISDNESTQDSTVQEDEASEVSENSLDEDYEPDEADLSSDDNNSASEVIQKPKAPSFTKKNYCYVCGKGVSKIARHLLRHADEEPDIDEAFALPKNSKERKNLLDELRNRGNYKHNQEVFRTNSGDLKLRRRPITTTFSAKTYVHCMYCKGMFRNKDMWRHLTRCPKKYSNSATPRKTRVLNKIAGAESSLSEKSRSDVWNMLLAMKQDETTFVIQNDDLLLQLAHNLSEKYVNDQNKKKCISSRLREMGRLLLALHQKSIFSFEEAVKPKNFYKIVETVKDIACFSEKKQSYKKPSLAIKLGQSLQKISSLILNRTDNDEQTVTDTKAFVALCAEEWNELVSSSLNAQNVNCPSTIPFTHDVQAFYMYLETTSASAIKSMKMYESPQVYSALCRVTLAQTFVLNKGAFEVSRMTLKSFQESGDTTQVLSKNFIRINILSKTGQNVAVLLTSELFGAITLLVTKRMSCGVHKDNPFLFAKPDGLDSSLYHGAGCSRSFASMSRAKNPKHLRSTHFQKHIARIFQILNLENDELNHLAKLLNHEIRTDRDYYRSPEAAVDLAKIAKLLLAKEKGSLERFKGNSLDEIEIEDELEPDVENSSFKNSDAEENNDDSDVLLQQSDNLVQQGRRLTPRQDALEHIKACKDKPFLEGIFIDSVKGRGVFTHEYIAPSDFVVEYRGNILTRKETQKNNSGDTLENYLFDLSWKGTNWCIDASEEDGSLGRLVNDDHVTPNCEMKKVVSEGKPHLCLFALKKIFAGEEITYNYGDFSYPWRSTESSEKQKTSQTDVKATASSPRNEREDSSSADSWCDDDYVPDNEPSSDDDSSSSNNQQSQDFRNKSDFEKPGSSKQQNSEQQSINELSVQQEDEEANMDKNPSYTKRNYCYVCGKAQSKFARHLFTHRKEEAEIAEVFALPRHSKERKIRLQNLRNRGNGKHNQEESCCGELKVRKRKNVPRAKSYVPCIYCKGMYVRREMWRHLQKCSRKELSKPPTATNNKILCLVAATVTDPQEISADLREILKTLKKDEISSVVWNDFYILQLAQCLCQMKVRKPKYEDLKQKLRDMGRLMLTLRKMSICSFEDALKPKNFSKVVEAVREIAGVNEESKSCDRPAVLLRLGRLLRTIGNIKYARALKEDADKETLQEAETFMVLCAKEWIVAPQSKLKASNASNIPFTHEVQLFYQYIEKTAASAVHSLTMYESAPVYIALLRVTVALVSVLNKSASDVSRVTLQSFNEREETELQQDAAVCQSQFEQILCKRFVKVKLLSRCGKKARSKKVVVMLTPELLNAITLLVHKREACGVHKNNPFLFARPANICTSFYRGQMCINTVLLRCGAKNLENLRSPFFRKHMARIFQILSLTNDELDQLAKLLGRDIRTNREYYQMPEAAVDIAKILQLLSAMEKGSLEKFEGKSLEEIEIEDELQPNLEHDIPDSDYDEEDNEEAESCLQPSGVSSSRGSVSSTKKKGSSGRKRGRPRSRRLESESEESELIDKKNDENTQKDDRTEDMPVKKPEETLSHSKEDATNIYFSDDDDDDINVDFDLDIDTDEGDGNYENDGDGDSVGLALTPVITDVKEATNQNKDISDSKKKDSSTYKHTTDTEPEEVMDVEAENHVDQEGEQTDQMDVDSGSSSAIVDKDKKNKLSAALTGMKELKILIPKLDIENIQGRIHVSQLPSICSRWPVKDQLVQNNSNKCETSSPSTDINNKSSGAKDIEMMCSCCKKSMLKGQTAYQKKGFKDVFCSKNCLFEMFPTNRQTTKTCHYCLKPITQLLDLIMAVVDIRGTMKDFCSVTCLICFKSNTGSTQVPQPLCSMCNKSCTTTCELTLNETVHKFCSDSCLEEFRRDKMSVCENCNSLCFKTLVLKLEEETKTVCTERCLEHFKENIKTSHPCTMCHTSQPVSDMVAYKSSNDTVELFCSRTCVTSYKLGSALIDKLQGKKGPDQLIKSKRDSTVNENDPSPAAILDSRRITAGSNIVFSNCGKELLPGQTVYQPKSSPEVFCSASCLSGRHSEIKLVSKTCYNCFQVILRPHNIILAPVDDSGTMRELCSETCLASVNSKRSIAAPKPPTPPGPCLECKMCNRYCYCKFRLKLDGISHSLCSDTCFTNFRKVNNMPLLTCDVCSSIHLDRQFELKMEDGSKNICSEECLIKVKEKVKKLQLCLMCQTSHQMSDMVEDKNEDGSLNFFCSNRCMVVYKASFLTVTEKSKPSSEENDIKEVKPSPNVSIKEEPVDDEYNQKFPPTVSTLDIKTELNVAKEDLEIGSAFSVTGESKPAAPTLTHVDLPVSCSNCKEVLMDGETVYQRKGHTEIFCSTSCLLQFYQMKPVKKTCQFCLQVIQQDVIQAPVDSNGTMKDFCSQACLSAFNYKNMMSTKIPIVPVGSHSQCNMCGRYSISKYEFIQDDSVQKMCSEPCLNRFCNLNKLSVCENCQSCCKNPLMLKVEHGNKKLCSAECLAQVKKKIKTHQPCATCHTSKLISEMVENKNSEDEVELFCTSSCLMASKIQAISASGTPLNCDNCRKTTVPACHLAMSNGSIRNFCTLTCAMVFKETQKDMTAASNSTGVPDQTQCDFLKPPEKLLCAKCQRVIRTTPKVIQKKDKIDFVCSLACSQKFKRIHNITGMCAFCKNERIITDTKRIDGKDCYFCSDGCKMLYRDKMEKNLGKHCHLCAYCHSISTTVVTAKYDNKEEKFCSEDCSSNFKMLFYCVAKCDTCSREGKLKQSLPMLGQVKHFCDLKCLIHFCNNQIQGVDTDSSPARPSAAVDSSPVIANVISLASALGRHPSASSATAQHGSVPDIQTKVVGHASIQTVAKELKNKSMLCTPLVHNKGVGCTIQTVDTEAQTDNFVPKVLPVPVPVYVPLPLNMYSQYTPKPVGLPLPLPVPVFFPVMSGGPEPAVKERIQPETSEGKSGMETKLKDQTGREDGQKGREMVKEGERQETQMLTGQAGRGSHDLKKEDLNSFNSQEENFPNTSLKSHSLQHTHRKSPAVSGVGMPSEPQPGLPLPAPPDSHSLPSPATAPLPLQQTLGKVNNKNKGRKLQQMSNAENQEASQGDSKVMSRKHHKLNSQSGIDAWKRWIQWKTSQTNEDPESPHAAKLKENILHYSAAELSGSLCRFIKEVKRPDGKSYSPSSLFFLCLSIQQYLFENGRMENIFSDLIYTKFSTEFTKILKHFKPTVTASGYLHSRVEEDYLWDCKQLGAYSPVVLLNTLLFFCSKYIGFTTVEQHRRLSFAHVIRCTKANSDNTKTTFLRFSLPVSVNESETDTNMPEDADGVPAKKCKKNENKEDFLEMMENTKNPLRCPIRLYEFYLSKCPESVRQRSDLFYLQPDCCCIPSSPVWFSSSPLDDSTMEAMLVRILTVRQLRGGR